MGLTTAEAQPFVTEILETSQEELATGSIFAGRYQVIEELGKGGMGKIYRVLNKKLDLIPEYCVTENESFSKLQMKSKSLYVLFWKRIFPRGLSLAYSLI